MKKQNGAEKTCAIFLPESGLERGFSTASTFDVRGRRSSEAAKGTHKRSLWAVPLDGMVRWLVDHESNP
ncbi:MAG: hypothetical protein LWW81_07175, partial [Rhodocyclales bacterium]|nr:hypothetical protein [Rhodocyclales bacterium]